VNGKCFDGSCVCYAGYDGPRCDVAVPNPNQNSLIGTNLGGIAYWTTEWCFVDVMKMSSDWVSLDQPGYFNRAGAWGNGMPINLRVDGYPAFLLPGQIVGKLMLRDVHLHAPSGQYVCLYDGDGEIDFQFDASVVLFGKGRVEFKFTPTEVPGCTLAYCSDNGIFLRLLKTNPANPVRNIRVIMPGFESTYQRFPFHPYFLKSLEHYSVIRFKDWQGVDNSKEKYWKNRTLPSFASQAGHVSYEHIVDLSNQLGANPWISVPHLADDNYVLNLALFLNSTLRHDLKLFIEYSNEVWNLLFDQGKYAQATGLALNLSPDKWTAQYRFYSQRSTEIFAIFDQVFKNSKIQVEKVLSTWTISTAATTEIVTWKSAWKKASVVAVAPYFDCGSLGSPSNSALISTKTVSQVVALCNATMPSIVPQVSAIATIARKYNLSLTTYEAGQSLVESAVIEWGNGDNPALTALFIAVNRHPSMTMLYTLYINALIRAKAVSVAFPMMQFVNTGFPTKYGSWGCFEFTGKPISATPKYQAFQSFFHGGQTTAARTNAALGFGVSDDTRIGFPAILSPRSGDVWFVASSKTVFLPHTIQWSNAGVGANAFLALYLWKGRHFNPSLSLPPQLQLMQVITANVSQALGQYRFLLPGGNYSSSTPYFIEFRGQSSSNFSEYFSILSCGECLQTGPYAIKNQLFLPSLWQNASYFSSCLQPKINISGSCVVGTNGCRQYRKLSTGRPIQDCVAQVSPFQMSSVTVSGPTGKPTAKLTRKATAKPTSKAAVSGPTGKPTAKLTRKATAKPTSKAAGLTGKPTANPTKKNTANPTTKKKNPKQLFLHSSCFQCNLTELAPRL